MSKTGRARVLVVAAMAFLPAPAAAQTRAGAEFTVNTYTTHAQRRADAAVLRDGGFVIVWQSNYQDGDSLGVFGQRYAVDGTPAGSEFGVNDYVSGVQQRPQVAALRPGGFVVTWSGHGPGDPDEGVFARLYDRLGSPRSPAFLVNTTTTAQQWRPAVAAGPGGFVVVWAALDDGSGFGVFGQRYDAAGDRAGGEFQVNTYTFDAQYAPHVAMAADGRFVVVWSSLGQDGDGAGVYGQRFAAAGAPAGGEFRVNTTTASNAVQPRVGNDAAGNFVVAWSAPDGSFLGAFGQRFDREGGLLGSEFLVHQSTADQTDQPQVAVDASGNVTVVFRYLPNIVGPRPGLFARRFDRGGVPREPSFQVHAPSPGMGNDYGAVASDGAGNMVVAWERDHTDIRGQRFGGLRPVFMAVNDVAPGNGNSVFDPGETLEVWTYWANRNGQALTFTGSAASFTGPAPGGEPSYAVVDGAANYGTVPHGATGLCAQASPADCFRLAISMPSTRPPQHWDAILTEDILPATIGLAHPWRVHVGGSFADVPVDSLYYRSVESLLHHSVSVGCAPGLYCPASSTTREQMAVFVLTAREGAGYLPPACTTPLFADVPASSPYCRWIEEAARRGVTVGCGGGRYCPWEAVLREQMAVFVVRALNAAIDPPACNTPTMFLDVPASSPYCRWIEYLARGGVVGGCGGGNYCPTQPVTREQMAVFLAVTFTLALYAP